MKSLSRNILDKFGPYGSAIGAVLGVILIKILTGVTYDSYYLSRGYYLSFLIFLFLPSVFAYIFCTCTHRKYLIYSPGALGGFLGAFVGYIIYGNLSHSLARVIFAYKYHNLLLEAIFIYYGLLIIILPPLTFFPSWYMCRRAQRKEARVEQT